MPTQQGQRLAFQNAYNAIKAAGMNPASKILSQSFIRTEAPMSTSATQYKFDLLTTENSQPAQYPTQNKLNQQDVFVVSNLFFGLFVPVTANGADGTLMTYPKVGLETNAVGNYTAANAMILNSLYAYNGFLSLTVNQTTVIPSWDLFKHLKIPVTQLNATTTGGATGVVTAPVHSSFDAIDGSEDGFYPVEPNVVISGSKKNLLTINLPTAIATIPTNGRLVIIMRGILAQNASAIN